ncbi:MULTISPECIES: heptaprenyl diphosphate synthase component 1 [Bacillus]|uniref:heptaprenyl diphosphate synthase component 1 n=1 Tax=Bacillus TaxID=1386 RepID=UPI00030010B4|nr:MULTISPECIES: heptaprenyl diphosphate synthase component 1 [Bacillus]
MENIYNYSKDIKSHIISKAYHPYLRRFLKEPVIEEKKILLLILLLQELKITDEERDQYITATMLVQTALDIHDEVSSSKKLEDPEVLKQRQLTILAGDYYSGLYYYILSQFERIDLIRSLAEGIKEINEKKIIYIQNQFATVEDMLNTVKVIESSLIVKVEECFGSQKYKHFIEDYLLLHRLQKEYATVKNGNKSLLCNGFSKIRYSKDMADLTQSETIQLIEYIDIQIKALRDTCVNELKLLFPHDVSLSSIFKTTLAEDGLTANSFVEEG